jgi:hypothetical protein
VFNLGVIVDVELFLCGIGRERLNCAGEGALGSVSVAIPGTEIFV